MRHEEDLGGYFKQILDLQGRTQKELADNIGKAENTISGMLKAGAKRWNVVNFESACRFLGLGLDEFFDDIDNGNVVKNINGSAFLGDCRISINNRNDVLFVDALLREKDSRISILENMIELQKKVIALYEKNSESGTEHGL